MIICATTELTVSLFFITRTSLMLFKTAFVIFYIISVYEDIHMLEHSYYCRLFYYTRMPIFKFLMRLKNSRIYSVCDVSYLNDSDVKQEVNKILLVLTPSGR
jgi:hypothetical protein